MFSVARPADFKKCAQMEALRVASKLLTLEGAGIPASEPAMTMHSTTSTLLLGFCVAATGLAAQELPADIPVKEAIELRLAHQSIEGVIVSFDGRAVMLKGCVATLSEKNRAREEAWAVNDFGPVLDEVAVVPGCDDERLAAQVQLKIRHFVFFTIFDDVDATVTDGVVKLTGTVTEAFKTEDFGEIIARIPGVRDIQDAVRWTPATQEERALRYAVARRLYADPLLLHHATEALPAIHVIVSGNHVTLSGTVHSDRERQAAGQIVRETVGVESCQNDLRTAISSPPDSGPTHQDKQ